MVTQTDGTMDILELDRTDPAFLIIHAWRKMIFSQGVCRISGKALGESAAIAEAIALFLKRLSSGSRRMLTVGHPGCPELTSDERQMIAVIAASQVEDDVLQFSHLSWLVQSDHREAVAEAANLLGHLLGRQGLYFPLPEPQISSAAPMLTVVREVPHVA